MIISGLLKTTLLDYPQHVAATVFLGGCNFRCPFCHNSDLLEGGNEVFSEKEVLDFLKKEPAFWRASASRAANLLCTAIWNRLSGK